MNRRIGPNERQVMEKQRADILSRMRRGLASRGEARYLDELESELGTDPIDEASALAARTIVEALGKG
jgi:hypothetical protein